MHVSVCCCYTNDMYVIYNFIIVHLVNTISVPRQQQQEPTLSACLVRTCTLNPCRHHSISINVSVHQLNTIGVRKLPGLAVYACIPVVRSPWNPNRPIKQLVYRPNDQRKSH